MRQEDWVGRKIVSQYGLVCEVIDTRTVAGKVFLVCRSLYNSKVWEWAVDLVSLVTHSGEIVDSTGQVFGKLVGEHWELYSEGQCRQLHDDREKKDFSSDRP